MSKPNQLVFKPVGENTRRFVAVLPNRFTGNTRSVELLDSSGNVIESGRFRSVANAGRGNWDFQKPGSAYGGTQVRITLDNGEQIIRNYGGNRYEEDFTSYGGGGSTADQAGGQASSGGGLSGGGFSAQNLFGGVGGGAVGATSLPFDISGLYPNFEKVSSNPIEFGEIDTAPYKFTDTLEFGKKFGDANRENFRTNFDQSQELGLKTLDTELKGLQSFAPAASALKREQTSLDNTFNQAQRTEQIDTTLPGARGVFDRAERTLNRQGDRAATYAQGRLTDDQLDRALELGIRSGAADTASFGGFGARSQQASRISDLQSAL